MPIGKLQGVVMSSNFVLVDLTKDRRLMLDRTIVPRPQSRWLALNLMSKSKLSSRQNAHRDAQVVRCCESSCACAKVACRQLVANLRRAGFDAVEAVVTQLGTLPLESPSTTSILSSFSSQRINVSRPSAPRDLAEINFSMETIINAASNRCSLRLSNQYPTPRRYVVMPTFVQLLERNREVVSMNFCPLDISRRASSARAPISSFSHS